MANHQAKPSTIPDVRFAYSATRARFARPGGRALRAAAVYLAFLAALAAPAYAQTQEPARAKFKLGGDAYAGAPFLLDLVVVGFDKNPAPEEPKLELRGATATPLGATPNVSSSIQIINGRRSESTTVTWVLRWRVVAEKPGRLVVPATTVKQGSKQATAESGEVAIEQIGDASDMRVSLELPKRAVFVGETFPVKLTWLFRRQPARDPVFDVPMLGLPAFTVSVPPLADPQRAISITGGEKDLAASYEVDRTTESDGEYTRLTTTFLAAPRTVGKIEVPPSAVIAPFAVGRGDFFGNAPTRPFRAKDAPKTLEVKALPESGRPPTFAGAVGEQFAIDVQTSRSVVKLGEPVELAIKVKSNQRLDALSLGRLDGDGRLPKDKFTVPAESPTGELSEDGMTKTFKVVAQVTGPATEVPALAFAYFDPAKTAYQTIQSQPIALSVGGSSVVGAGDVVGGAPGKRAASAPADDTASVNAELALSSAGAVDDRPLSGSLLWVLVGLLYAIPLAVFGVRTWQLRTADRREEASEVRAARRRVEELLDRSGTAPAREIAGPLVAALREFARALGRPIDEPAGSGDDANLLARLETESFAPGAASQPLSTDLRSDAAGLLRRWSHAARAPKRSSAAARSTALILAGVTGLALPADAHADALADGRSSYQQAMSVADPTARKTAFARAAVSLGEAARERPDHPELLADWGNAALGAGDVATATLAYRRALAIDGGNARARRNLGWLRSRQSDLFRPTTSAGATEALLFFHAWPRASRLLVGAAAFAIAILLLVPWSMRAATRRDEDARGGSEAKRASGYRRRRGLSALAVLPIAIWLAMIISVAVEDRHDDDAVVMDAVVMRAADSAGAPAALTQPVQRGAEVAILERRADWTRIRVASGTQGWIPSSAVEPI